MENHLDLIRILDHMVVGNNIPVLADDKSRSKTFFLSGLGSLVVKRRKKPFKPILVSAKGLSEKMLKHTPPALDCFKGLDVDNPCPGMFRQIGKTGRDHLDCFFVSCHGGGNHKPHHQCCQ